MTKPYRAIPSDEIAEKLSPERRAHIAARASELLSEQMTLREIRNKRAEGRSRTRGKRKTAA
jgi:hypothetical protein